MKSQVGGAGDQSRMQRSFGIGIAGLKDPKELAKEFVDQWRASQRKAGEIRRTDFSAPGRNMVKGLPLDHWR